MFRGWLLVALASASCSAAPTLTDKRADQLIERTHATKATYALVSTNELRQDSGTTYEFAAEFNQGDLHRVETPRDRIVGNCRTGQTAHLNVESGKISHGDRLSEVICGIYVGDGLKSAELIGSGQSQFGPVQKLKIVTGFSTRTYDVASNGAIVAETITDPDGNLQLAMKALSLSDQLPNSDLFSEASLQKSAIPEDLRTRASDPNLWRAARR